MSRDVIVIGAGVNGLTTAGLLAKAGKKVLVLERRSVAGGLAASDSFHPGYRTAGVLHDTSAVHPAVVDALRLTEHGLSLSPEPASVLGFTAGDPASGGLLLHHDPEKAAAELEAQSAGDAQGYRDYRKFIATVRPIVDRFQNEKPPDPETLVFREAWKLFTMGLSLRRLGKDTMMELMRIAPMCVADWLNEQFSSDLLKVTLAGPGLMSAFVGPWSPGTASNLLFWESAARGSVAGGPAAVVGALEKAVTGLGVTIRCDADVEQILVSKGAVTGVRLAGGEEVTSSCVAASCDSRHTFLQLISSRDIPFRLEDRIRHIRGEGVAAKINLALNGPLEFASRPGEPVSRIRIAGPDFDAVEKTFDPVKYNELGSAQTLDVFVPSVENPDVAPPGHSVVSILATSVPYDLNGGWTEDARSRLGDQVVNTLAVHAPKATSSLVAREVLSPPDLEERYGAVRGHLYHGDHALDQQLVRPAPECSQYTTPVAGLFLCGSGSHPGGGVTGAPGVLAAQAILSR